MLGRHWRYALILAFVAVVAASTVPSSFAHPVYLDSSPKAFQSVPSSPAEVSVFFSEPIELSYSKISVLGPDGSRVDRNDAHNVEGDTASIGVSMQPGLPEGVYTVQTRTLSAVDGHVVEETFTFGVGVPGGSGSGGSELSKDILSPGESASRFPGMVGQIMAVGAAFGSLWLWKPLSRVPWLSSALAQARVAIDKSMLKIIIVGSALVLASGVAMIVVQATSIDAGILEAISTKFGNVWVTRMLQSSIMLGIAAAVYHKARKNNTSPSRAEMLAILVVGLAVLVTSSLIAHAAATGQVGPIILDFFHNAAASIWIGGIILLGFAAVPKLLKLGDERARSAALALLIPRFSVLVVTILGIAVITGPVLLFSLESDLSLTLSSVYGQVLAVKLGLAGAMVALGAYSQFTVQKRAVAAMAGGGSVQVSSLKHYGKTLKVEAAIGIALVLAVSIMANGALPEGQFPSYQRQQEPQAQEAFAQEVSTDYARTAYTPEGKISLSISPFAVGQNNFKLSFTGQDGNNVTGIESATIKLTQLERGIGPITVETKKSGNVFSADAAFSLPGTWLIEIEGVNSQGSNMLASIDANVKPQVSSLQFDIKQYNITGRSLPLYPVFDAQRQSIWVGDSFPGSGRVWQLDIATGNYAEHKINGTNLVTMMTLAPDGKLWYIDPIGGGSAGGRSTGALGFYNPDDDSAGRFIIPEVGTASGVAMDGNGSLWVTLGGFASKIAKFDPASEKFSFYDTPTQGADPRGIAADGNGNLWFAESTVGKIAKINITSGEIKEYAPPGQRVLDEPTAIFADPKSNTLYISEHTGHTITAFNTFLGTFREYPSVNEGGLPFGMAMDSYGNLWYAEHEIDRVAVIDPRTGAGTEAKIPITGSFIQWITADDKGKIWFAAQQGGALGSITITSKPTVPPADNGSGGPQTSGGPAVDLGFSFTDVAGPGIAAGVVLSALFYAKSATDLRRNTRAAQRLG